MKMSVKATELRDTDVSFVSMVKNGAVRMPFKITKSEDEMSAGINLGSLFKRALKADTAVGAIVAVSMRDAMASQAADILKHAGLDLGGCSKEVADGITTYTKKGEEGRTSDITVVALKGDIAVGVTGLQKGFSGYDWDSTDFGTVMGSGGYCQGVSTASDMLDMTIANILAKADDPAAASSMIGAAIDDFRTYITNLTKSLPVQAFKMEGAMAGLAKADKKAPAGKWVDGKWVADGAEPMAKAEWGDGDKPAGWDDMTDDAKAKWKKQQAQKEEDIDLRAVPFDRPAWLSKERHGALMALKQEACEAAVAKGDPCWDGYEQVGTKEKDGKTVPNCVPKKDKAKKGDLPIEKPAWMSRAAYAEFYKAEMGQEWPQGDLTNGHGGGASQGQGTGTTPSATADDKKVPDNLGSTTSTELPTGALAVHKASYDELKKNGATAPQLAAFVKAITFDPTKDQSVSGAEMGDGKGFADAKAPPKGTADEDYEKAMATKARGALGMKKADGGGGQQKIALTSPDQKLPDDQSGAGASKSPDPTIIKNEIMAALGGELEKFGTALLAKVDERIGVVSTSVGKLGTRLDGIGASVAKTEQAMNGTVFNHEAGDETVLEVRKNEARAGAAIPLLDTARDRRRVN